ncbi:hypothetical protein N7470_009677 [Penicillium chermesinum]|nr:hypothetical protein N7470_009677 [Penicillium chermesinum]
MSVNPRLAKGAYVRVHVGQKERSPGLHDGGGGRKVFLDQVFLQGDMPGFIQTLLNRFPGEEE